MFKVTLALLIMVCLGANLSSILTEHVNRVIEQIQMAQR